MSTNPSSPARTIRGLPYAFWLLVVGMLVNRLGAFVLPFLTLYLGEQQGLSARESGLVIGAWGGGAVIAALVGGHLADRWGRKRTMLASLCGGALVLFAFAQVTGVWALAGLALTLGAVAEVYRPAVSAAITDLTAPEQRGRAFGYLIWSYNIGFAISPVLAGAIAKHLGFEWLFYGDALTMLAAALVIALWVPETRPAAAASASKSDSEPAGGFALALRDRSLQPMLIAALAMGMSIVQVVAAFGPLMRADGIDIERYGRIIALNGLGIALTQPWLVPRAESFGARRLLPTCALIFCWGFALHAFVDTPRAHMLAVAVWTIGEVTLFPLCNAFVSNLAPVHLRGRYQGLYAMAWASANVIGPPLGQELLARFGANGWALLPASCGVIASVCLLIATRRAAPHQ